MKRIRTSMCLCAAILLGLSVQARAGALDDRVPADSVLYVGWAGADSLAPQYNASKLKKILDASAIGEFLNKQLPELITQATRGDEDAAQKIAQLKRGLNIAWRHPVAFYFCPVDMTNPRKPGLRFGLLCEAGADAKELHDLIAPALREVPPNADVPVKLTQEGTAILLAFGKADSIADLKAGGTLSALPAYTKAMAQVQQPGQAVAFYGDIQKIIAMVNDAIIKADAPPDVKTKVPVVIQSLGLNSLTQVALLSGFNGQNWSEHAFIGINGPRTGILSLIDGAPIPETLLAVIPQKAAAFSVSRFDIQKLYTEARKVITTIEPRAIEELDRGIAEANRELGVNIEKDVINALGDEWAYYRAPLEEGGLSMTLINRARDGAALTKAIDTVEKLFNGMEDAPFKIEKVKTGGMEVSALMFLTFNVAWTVRNDYLYVSTLNGISAAVNQVEKTAPSIATSDLYKGVMTSLLPAGAKPTAITYSHPARLYPELRNLILGVLPLIRQQAKVDVPMDLLPDPASVSEFMTPGGSVTWSDAAGFHGAGISAFPGAMLLGGNQPGLPAMAGVGALGIFGMRSAHVQHQPAVVDLP